MVRSGLEGSASGTAILGGKGAIEKEDEDTESRFEMWNDSKEDNDGFEAPDDSGEDNGGFEAPDDSGEDDGGFEAPDDSGEDAGGFEAPDDSGEDDDRLEAPDDSGEKDGQDTTKESDANNPYDKDGKLRPCNQYELNGYRYKTDERGQIIRVEGTLTLDSAERNQNAQKKVGKLGGDGYDGGHVIGRQFGGDGNTGNLVPMKRELNRAGGEYYKMEKEWKDALSEGCVVNVDIRLEYDGDSKVPSKIIVVYQIDGETTKKVFDNI